MSKMFSSNTISSKHPNIPGAWTAGVPKAWSEPPKTLNPKFYAPESQPSDAEDEIDLGDRWQAPRKGVYEIELQSLKEYSPPLTLECSSSVSTRIFSPEVPHECDLAHMAQAAVSGAIEPHMTKPLLPDSAPLDFSCLMPQARLVMARAAAPMASCCDFGAFCKTDETVLLHVMDEEFERISTDPLYGPELAEEPQTLSSMFKELVVGLSPEEYHRKYYWTPYVHDESDWADDES